ncbi:MAG: C25 family cysteine peptidase, partial [Bacteroidota bacterium]
YYNVEADLVFAGGTGSDWSRMNSRFSGLLTDMLQTRPPALKKVLADEPMTLVVVADPMFRDSLQTMLRWKREKGFRVLEAYTDDPALGGTATGIREWLRNIYLNPPDGFTAPDYLLLVGDVEQIPLSPLGYQNTDLYYAEYDGNGDYIPELFYGRISAQTVEQFVAVRDKILEYERYAFPDPSFLNRSVLIAGVDASYSYTHANGQIYYAENNYFNTSRGIESSVYYYPESAVSDAQIISDISSGAAFVNYTGHGTSSGWADPAFGKTDIAGLQNNHMYPVLIGNGCQTNAFVYAECFSEAVTRAPEKGALAYIGCTNDSYWDEDYYWSVGLGPIVSTPLYENTQPGYYDKVFHTHSEDNSLWAPSLGEMVYAGNMSVQVTNSTRKRYYWEIYQLMGDPTLVPWFTVPTGEEVVFPSAIPLETRQFGVEVRPFDYVAVSRDGVLIDARHADASGYAYLSLPDTLTQGDLLLVVTGDYRIPFMDTVKIGPSNAGYVEVLSVDLSDESVASDGYISGGEEFSVSFSLKNQGLQTFTSDSLLAHIRSDQITGLDTVFVLPAIQPGETYNTGRIFRFLARESVDDLSEITIMFICKHDSLNNRLYFKGTAHAPRLVSERITWSDGLHGNADGIIDPGETLDFEWVLRNEGHFPAYSLSAAYSGGPSGNWLSLAGADELAEILAGAKGVLQFRATVSAEAKDSLYQSSAFRCSNGTYFTSDSLRLFVGRAFETFQYGDFSFFDWQADPQYPWTIDSAMAFNGRYSARSADIADLQHSDLELYVNNSVADSVSFYFRISSESGYDYLIFYIDTLEAKRWSGLSGWKRYSCLVGEGTHRLLWRYEKDKSISTGEDAAWIDEIVLPGDPVLQSDIELTGILAPESGLWLTDQEEITISFRNNSPRKVSGISAAYEVDGTGPEAEMINIEALPGQSYQYTFLTPADFSGFAEHTVHVLLELENDNYPANNVLDKLVVHPYSPDIAIENIRLDSVPYQSVDLYFDLRNAGNSKMDSVFYNVGITWGTGYDRTKEVNLLPGEVCTVSEELFNADKWDRNRGWYSFEIISFLTGDVNPENNFYTGMVFWSGSTAVEQAVAANLLVWPNPTRGELKISLSQAAEKDLPLRVFAPDGRVIYETKMLKGQSTTGFSLAGYTGICYLQIGEAPQFMQKIVITGD